MTDHAPSRSYQLTRPDGVGFLRHWSGRQVAVAFVGLFIALSALRLHGALPLKVLLVTSGASVIAIGLGKTLSGELLLDVAGACFTFLWSGILRRHRWVAPVSVVGAEGAVPPLFGGVVLHDLDPLVVLGRAGMPIGAIEDRADGTVSVVLRVHGAGFAVADPADKDARVALWGQALADFCRERHPVVRVTWSQWSAPAGIEEHRTWMGEAIREDADPDMRAAYEEVLDRVGRAANLTETLVTLSVSRGRVRPLPHHNGSRLVAAVERALDEVELLARQLRRADLVVAGPLNAGQVAQAMRVRLDPRCKPLLDRRNRAKKIDEGVSPHNAYPLSIEEHRTNVACDAALHRAFRVAEWPRTQVPAEWMRDFLGTVGVVRMVTLIYHPQSRRKSRWEVDSQASRTDGAIDEKIEKRHRVGANLRRASAAIEQIDEELEAGSGMMHFTGIVVVSAQDEEELQYSSERIVQAGSNAGIELRPLDWRHGRALVAALPVGRSLREGNR